VPARGVEERGASVKVKGRSLRLHATEEQRERKRGPEKGELENVKVLNCEQSSAQTKCELQKSPHKKKIAGGNQIKEKGQQGLPSK